MIKNRRTGSLIAVLTFMMVAGLMSCGKPGEAKKQVDYTAPPIVGVDINGKGAVSLAQMKGKVVLVNFWATWCPPCRAEIPDLIRLQEKYSQDLVILGISVDKDGAKGVQEYSQEMGMNYPVIMGENQVVMAYGGIRNIPTSFIVDKQGDLVGKIVGSRSFDEFEAQLLPFINK